MRKEEEDDMLILEKELKRVQEAHANNKMENDELIRKLAKIICDKNDEAFRRLSKN